MAKDRELFAKEVDELTPEESQGRVAKRLRQQKEYPRSRIVQELAEKDLERLTRVAKERVRKQ